MSGEDLDDPYLRVGTARGQVRILLCAEDDPATVENCDGFIDLDDGTTRSFTVLTLAEIARLMDRWQVTGEEGGGRYLLVPDLIVLRAGGVDEIVPAVEALADQLPELTIWDGHVIGPVRTDP